MIYLTALVVRGPASRGEKFFVSLDRVDKERGSALCAALFAGFCSEPALHSEKFLFRVRLDNAV